jgi:hypothetical protein
VSGHNKAVLFDKKLPNASQIAACFARYLAFRPGKRARSGAMHPSGMQSCIPLNQLTGNARLNKQFAGSGASNPSSLDHHFSPFLAHSNIADRQRV